MKKHLITALLMTAITTVLLGLIYPLTITALAQAFFREKANGQIIYRNGKAIGSRIIGQPFTGPQFFHSRPSSAGNGYDAMRSGGSNLAPTNKKLIDAVEGQVQSEHRHGAGNVPIDLVTSSASGLDPDITPAAAYYQVRRVARARGMNESVLRRLVEQHTEPRELGFLGEERVNVLELNLALDQWLPNHPR
ncbi:MAG TPA: potassium-transporting ATPase subunit KdpC [Pseudomonadales bacterium]|nr:potassium-transporting ATPase subunit KdpC [Pseudomonadales bacterium]